MRIAMVGTRGIPARCGGVERVVEQLSRELVSRGHDVIVYSRRSYVAGAGAPHAGRRIVTPGLGGKHLDTISHTATAMVDLLRRRADIVHIHSPGPALLSWIPALAGKPIVLTVHAPDWRRDKWSPVAKAALVAGLTCGMRLADAVTAVSPSLADALAAKYNREVSCVPNAAPHVLPQPANLIRKWGLGSEDYGLYVGRIVPEKRLELLLRAWAAAKVSARLVVAGRADTSRYGRSCRNLAGRNVLFLGPQFGRTLAELYSNAAVVIQPSVLEGMSLVLLEAAAYGRCIVAADIAANRDTLADSILYFRRDNISELAELICRCLNRKALRSDKGRQARQLVEGRYCWPIVADRMERVYTQVLSACKGKR